MKANVFVLILALSGAPSCRHTSYLDDSYGLAYRATFRTQAAARQGRDVVTAGQDVESAVAKHYVHLAPEQGSGRGAPASTSGLKIPALLPP